MMSVPPSVRQHQHHRGAQGGGGGDDNHHWSPHHAFVFFCRSRPRCAIHRHLPLPGHVPAWGGDLPTTSHRLGRIRYHTPRDHCPATPRPTGFERWVGWWCGDARDTAQWRPPHAAAAVSLVATCAFSFCHIRDPRWTDTGSSNATLRGSLMVFFRASLRWFNMSSTAFSSAGT